MYNLGIDLHFIGLLIEILKLLFYVLQKIKNHNR